MESINDRIIWDGINGAVPQSNSTAASLMIPTPRDKVLWESLSDIILCQWFTLITSSLPWSLSVLLSSPGIYPPTSDYQTCNQVGEICWLPEPGTTPNIQIMNNSAEMNKHLGPALQHSLPLSPDVRCLTSNFSVSPHLSGLWHSQTVC